MTELQKRILEIFKEVSAVLDRNNIEYFAIGGTCIGAVRHHGFIPWDDDLDIAVPIEQFSNMQEKLKAELPDYLSLYTGMEIRHYRSAFIKVIDKRTTYIERSEFSYHDSYKGVFVDIMPLAGVEKSRFFYNRIRFYHVTNIFNRTFVPGKSNFAIKVCKLFLYSLPVKYNFFLKRYMRFLEMYPFSSASYTGYVWSGCIEELTFPKENFNGTVRIPFEDTFIKCPVGYDAYLTKQFGDYMTLPPEQEREGHHYALIKFDTPYKYYQNNPNRVLEDYVDV